MAIYPTANPSAQESQPSSTAAINIEAWTQEATQSLQAVSISTSSPATLRSSNLRGTSVSLAIPLDEQAIPTPSRQPPETNRAPIADPPSYRPRREPLRRDSLKRREALLKGKEGSRRRQRWENDRLLNNPWAQPPLPSDWEVHPTYPKHAVPYYLAPLWDAEMASRASAGRNKRGVKGKGEKGEDPAGKVPKELREKMKRARGARGLLQDLEEEVRMFVRKWEEKGREGRREEVDSEDEEIVFVGRNGHMDDMPSPQSKRSVENNVEREKLVFDSLVDDHGASFGRWLVHSIASWYGLKTWSVTVGDPARRQAYVGIDEVKANTVRRPVSPAGTLPKPLWVMV